MTKPELKEKAIEEIESALWHLGSNDSTVFPSFTFESCELDYGIQRDNEDILLETKYSNAGNKILVRVKIEIEEV